MLQCEKLQNTYKTSGIQEEADTGEQHCVAQ